MPGEAPSASLERAADLGLAPPGGGDASSVEPMEGEAEVLKKVPAWEPHAAPKRAGGQAVEGRAVSGSQPGSASGAACTQGAMVAAGAAAAAAVAMALGLMSMGWG